MNDSLTDKSLVLACSLAAFAIRNGVDLSVYTRASLIDAVHRVSTSDELDELLAANGIDPLAVEET